MGKPWQIHGTDWAGGGKWMYEDPKERTEERKSSAKWVSGTWSRSQAVAHREVREASCRPQCKFGPTDLIWNLGNPCPKAPNSDHPKTALLEVRLRTQWKRHYLCCFICKVLFLQCNSYSIQLCKTMLMSWVNFSCCSFLVCASITLVVHGVQKPWPPKSCCPSQHSAWTI